MLDVRCPIEIAMAHFTRVTERAKTGLVGIDKFTQRIDIRSFSEGGLMFDLYPITQLVRKFFGSLRYW